MTMYNPDLEGMNLISQMSHMALNIRNIKMNPRFAAASEQALGKANLTKRMSM